MNRILLITRPKHDITVRYLFYWAKKIIELANSKSVQVLDLKEERANQKELVSMLKKRKPSLVFFNGHGDENSLFGHNDKILLEAGNNESILSGKVVYCLSCSSGKVLGPKSIKNGALGYLGYNDDFIFFQEQSKIGNPLDDKTAGLFLDASNQVMVSLLKGHNIKESHERSKKIFRENIAKVVSSESVDNYLVPFLIWDMQHQVCLGKESASF